MHQSIFVVGTTCSGKSHWSLELADFFREKMQSQACIINCDSVQIYKGLRVGAAQPMAAELLRAPHYLYDMISAPSEMTAGEYRRVFLKNLESPEMQNFKFRLIVGGTGFYFQALEKGMFELLPVEEEIRQAVLQQLQTQSGQEKAYKELQERDPEAGTKIHRADLYRIGRALEILRSSGRKVSDLHAEQRARSANYPEPLIKIGFYFEKSELVDRIKTRTQKMLQSGLVEETKEVLKYASIDWLPLRSVGYAEAIQFLNGKLTLAELEEQINLHTLQLAKRQRTWFKRDVTIQWFHGLSEPKLVFDKVISLLNLENDFEK